MHCKSSHVSNIHVHVYGSTSLPPSLCSSPLPFLPPSLPPSLPLFLPLSLPPSLPPSLQPLQYTMCQCFVLWTTALPPSSLLPVQWRSTTNRRVSYQMRWGHQSSARPSLGPCLQLRWGEWLRPLMTDFATALYPILWQYIVYEGTFCTTTYTVCVHVHVCKETRLHCCAQVYISRQLNRHCTWSCFSSGIVNGWEQNKVEKYTRSALSRAYYFIEAHVVWDCRCECVCSVCVFVYVFVCAFKYTQRKMHMKLVKLMYMNKIENHNSPRPWMGLRPRC